MGTHGNKGAYRSRLTHNRLQPAELKTLSLLASGKSNPEIAEILCVARSTVEKRISSIYEKLDIDTTTVTKAAARVQAANVWNLARIDPSVLEVSS